MASSKNVTSAALVAMATVVITAFVIAALYIGRDILIPLALAALLSFLLSPLVTRLERWVGRIAATLLAVTVLFCILSGVGWVLTRQVLDLATRLPDYKENIQTKLRSLKTPGAGRFKRFNKTLDELKKDLPGAELTGNTPDADATLPTTTSAGPQETADGDLPQPPPSSATPTPVEIVETKRAGPIEQFGAVIIPILGTSALVLLLLICMLLQREDLRGRLIRLIGSGNISAVTRGMDDAAQRVSRYLLMQLIVNATYGLVIGVALYFIGVPSAFVWGVLATVLRFIPYVGPWIAAAFPIALSLAVTNNWTMPLLTIGLFVVVELLSNNVMEPMLYGSSTGVSSIALIIAAVVWTWLWGPAGLALATPLTVCLVVMGRHVPRLGVLSVLLSDEEALAPHEEFYHRLLTPAADDASEFSDAYLKANSYTELYDSVLIPALVAVERDEKSGELDEAQYIGILQELRDVIEDLGMRPSPPSKLESDKAEEEVDSVTPTAPPAPVPTCRVLCLPVRAERDELAGTMLAQLLAQNDFPVINLSAKLTTGELLEAVEKEGAEALCISVTPPSTVIHARYLCGKLRARFPKLRLVIGLWGATEQLTETTARLRDSGADEVVTTLADAVVQLSQYATTLAQEAVLLAPPSDETERLAELQNLHLLDTKAEPVFDRITTQLARILNVPIALITFVDKERQFFKSQFGLPEDLSQARQTPRDVSVCSQVVAMDDVLVIEDLARDRRFAQNSLVKERGLRFYAGAPLRTTGGHVLGALCVLDTKPRHFGDHEKRLLQVMAEEVMEAINLRANSRTAEAA